MKAKHRLLLALATAVVGFALNQSAHARDYDAHRHHDHWKHGHHKHYHDHWKHGHRTYGYGVRERIVIERPVYVERYVHYAPPPPPRYPAIVLSVDLPPLVIPLR
jgi:hypothetical protein